MMGNLVILNNLISIIKTFARYGLIFSLLSFSIMIDVEEFDMNSCTNLIQGNKNLAHSSIIAFEQRFSQLFFHAINVLINK
jgi:hypothetical protein